jgi:hypothetical protein
MCTVSFIPGKDGIYLTSNRDEKQERKPALMPALHLFRNCEMIFPKDDDVGGTWITLCGNGNAGVLLNGAFTNHTKKDRYRKSRGLIFLEIMDDQNPVRNFQRHFLDGIEPFTLIIWQNHHLYECRWDEQGKKYCCSLPVHLPYIWSSSTLYNEDTRLKRQTWFQEWLNKYTLPRKDQIINFHRFGGEGNIENDLVMNRNGKVFTVSITSITVNRYQGSITYTDVVNGHESSSELFFNGERLTNLRPMALRH